MKFTPHAEFSEQLKRNIAIIIAESQKALENAKYALRIVNQSLNKIPESTKILAENGWYLSLGFDPAIINRMAEHIKDNNIEIADKEMIEFLDGKLNIIQDQIIERFPNRTKVIMAAIAAHKKGDYFLSIPVFFAQIEGICNELTGTRFFKVKNDKTKTAPWVSNFENDSILKVLLEPLKITGPMRRQQDIDNPTGINRHDVLHGDCTDYGESGLNSYKVLSLLHYITDTVYQAKKASVNRFIT